MSASADEFTGLFNKGKALFDAGQHKEATKLFAKAARLSPDAWFAVGMSLMKDGEDAAALARFQETLALTKGNKVKCACLNNIGMLLANRGQNQEALVAFDEARKHWPECPDSYSNLGLVTMWCGDFAGAFKHLNRALELDPWHEAAQFVRSMAFLLSGDYKHGFEEYECRWRSKTNSLRKVESNYPEWDGTNGTRVFVYGEQGAGDSILMLRYAREIRKRGLWQAWVGQKGMTPLLQTIPEIDLACTIGDDPPDFDCHIPAVSLPRLFGTTTDNIPPSPYIPMPEPHVFPLPDEELPETPPLQVGIAWRGSAVNRNDLFRSTNLSMWSEVLKVDGVTFHSLQVDGADEALLYPQIKTYDHPKDWLDTARRVSGCDLVISVDTSIVHLAGSMGVPCWCALHCRPYFVYPPSFGDNTPWYSSVKLFRQQKEFEWQPVFRQIAHELNTYTNSL